MIHPFSHARTILSCLGVALFLWRGLLYLWAHYLNEQCLAKRTCTKTYWSYGEPGEKYMHWAEFILQVYCVIELMLKFRTGYAAKTGRIEMTWQKVASKYARSWLLFDLAIAAPWFLPWHVKERICPSPISEVQQIPPFVLLFWVVVEAIQSNELFRALRNFFAMVPLSIEGYAVFLVASYASASMDADGAAADGATGGKKEKAAGPPPLSGAWLHACGEHFAPAGAVVAVAALLVGRPRLVALYVLAAVAAAALRDADRLPRAGALLRLAREQAPRARTPLGAAGAFLLFALAAAAGAGVRAGAAFGRFLRGFLLSKRALVLGLAPYKAAQELAQHRYRVRHRARAVLRRAVRAHLARRRFAAAVAHLRRLEARRTLPVGAGAAAAGGQGGARGRGGAFGEGVRKFAAALGGRKTPRGGGGGGGAGQRSGSGGGGGAAGEALGRQGEDQLAQSCGF